MKKKTIFHDADNNGNERNKWKEKLSIHMEGKHGGCILYNIRAYTLVQLLYKSFVFSKNCSLLKYHNKSYTDKRNFIIIHHLHLYNMRTT